MRRVTRNLVLATFAVVVVLLALGALPGFLASGDPYYVTATPANGSHESVDATNLSERSYPYTTAALADATPTDPGRSGSYRKGPVGLKEAFTHSPFDELGALRHQYPATTDGDAVYVRDGSGTLYRVAVTR